MKLDFKIVDRGFNDLKKLAGQMGAAKVGVVGAKAAEEHDGPEPMTNADLAVAHEFGTDKVPERSFIRSAFDANREKYLDHLKKVTRAIYDRRMSLARGLGLLGQEAASDTREKIREGIPPPNAPMTIARKGSSKPLIDTGQLLGSITYEVDMTGRADPDGHREQ